MTPISVAINGFGRIGKCVTRIALEDPNINIVCINDRSKTPEYIAYSFQYDSSHSSLFSENISFDNDSITINDNVIKIINESDIRNINWGKYHDSLIVIDCTGQNTIYDKAKIHLNCGAKKVIITSPSVDIPMFVFGCNEETYNNQKIVSCASCTTNASGPLLAIIDKIFKIQHASITTIHSITGSQNIVDGYNKKNKRLGRCGINNIIPSTTGASKSIEKVYSPLKDKCCGMAYRVPTTNASVIDMVITCKESHKIKRFLEKIQENTIIGKTNEELVSCDFINNSHSSTIDLSLSKQIGENLFKIVAWYDNEWGYSNRVIDTVKLIH